MAVKASNQAPENGRDNGRDANRNRRTVPNSPTAQSVAREDSWEAEQDNNIVPLTTISFRLPGPRQKSFLART